MEYQLILVGAPGSGKGTQAKKLEELCGYHHISTGDLLRSEMMKKSEIGLRVSEIVKSGKLVDDDTVIELLEKNLDFKNSKYIFDGFPRNMNQCLKLEEKILKSRPYIVFYLEISLSDLLDRIVYRVHCEKCGSIFNEKLNPPLKANTCDSCHSSPLIHREDDSSEILKNRFQIFQDSTFELIDHYKDKDFFYKIQANQDSNVVFQSILKKLKK
jgi:adenylate kinase